MAKKEGIKEVDWTKGKGKPAGLAKWQMRCRSKKVRCLQRRGMREL
jgi:hypothetical protein